LACKQRSKEEIEAKVLKISNENALFYESNIKSLKLQHGRELRCLQDELHEERQK
jgi:hypothetical protein